MAPKALIQNGFLEHDRRNIVSRHLQAQGYDVAAFDPDPGQIDRLPLDPDVFIFAPLWVMLRLLDRAGLTEQVLPSYPDCLSDMLHRDLWQGRFCDLACGAAAQQQPVFVKTRTVTGRIGPYGFGAQIVASLDVLQDHLQTAPDFGICCAAPVDWLSEWRVYVTGGAIIGASLYRPDLPDLSDLSPQCVIDFDIATVAVRRLVNRGQGAAGFCIDIGVMQGGQTALIEVNDGIALVNYALDPALHADLHRLRWRELMVLLGGMKKGPPDRRPF